MAKIRIGFSTHFEVENELVGIGTDNPTNTKQVLGNIHATNAKAVGVSTLATYQGFLDKEGRFGKSVIDINSQAGTLGEIVIDGEVTVSSGSTLCSGVDELTLTDSFSVPTGNTDSRIHCKTAGSMRFNEDLGTLEFYTGDEWRTVNSIQDTGNRGRGIAAGGEGFNDNIEFVNIQSLGNALDFGVLTAARANAGAVSSGIRGIYAGGEPATDLIQYITIASQGDAIDFDGNLTANRRFVTGCSSSTRGVFMGGSEPSRVNKIEYIEMGTAGVNAADFGDLTAAKDCGGGGSWSNGIRGGVMGGSPSNFVDIEVVTIASLGNAVKFGEAINSRHNQACASNRVRAIAGGGSPETVRIIQFFTMASDGNATFFGDLTAGRTSMNACADGTRVVFFGGNDGSAPKVNNIEFVTIATAGNGQDFGDLSFTGQNMMALSDSHGGLGGF